MTQSKFKVVFTEFDFPGIDIEKGVLSEIDCEIICPQTDNEDKLIEICRDADGIIIQHAHITEKIINSLTKCKVISRYGIGVDTIDLKAARVKGIHVCNVPDYCINEVADHSLVLILSLGRKIIKLSNSVSAGVWDTLGVAKPVYNFKNQVIGLIGFGKIPRNLFIKAKNLFKEILVYDPYIPPEIVTKFNLRIATFYEILRSSDFISIHCPLNDDTRYLFSLREFQLMKPTAYIVNTSRGAIINTKDLYQALNGGLIAGAGLDVLEKEPPGMDFELTKLDNVIITPHAGFYSESAMEDLSYKTAFNVLQVLKGEKPVNVVN